MGSKFSTSRHSSHYRAVAHPELERFTQSTGLYDEKLFKWKGAQDEVKNMIMNGIIAPRICGIPEDCGNSITIEECSLCYNNYDKAFGLNTSTCCGVLICSECFLHTQSPKYEKPCPFCTKAKFKLTYTYPHTNNTLLNKEFSGGQFKDALVANTAFVNSIDQANLESASTERESEDRSRKLMHKENSPSPCDHYPRKLPLSLHGKDYSMKIQKHSTSKSLTSETWNNSKRRSRLRSLRASLHGDVASGQNKRNSLSLDVPGKGVLTVSPSYRDTMWDKLQLQRQNSIIDEAMLKMKYMEYSKKSTGESSVEAHPDALQSSNSKIVSGDNKLVCPSLVSYHARGLSSMTKGKAIGTQCRDEKIDQNEQSAGIPSKDGQNFCQSARGNPQEDVNVQCKDVEPGRVLGYPISLYDNETFDSPWIWDRYSQTDVDHGLPSRSDKPFSVTNGNSNDSLFRDVSPQSKENQMKITPCQKRKVGWRQRTLSGKSTENKHDLPFESVGLQGMDEIVGSLLVQRSLAARVDVVKEANFLSNDEHLKCNQKQQGCAIDENASKCVIPQGSSKRMQQPSPNYSFCNGPPGETNPQRTAVKQGTVDDEAVDGRRLSVTQLGSAMPQRHDTSRRNDEGSDWDTYVLSDFLRAVVLDHEWNNI